MIKKNEIKLNAAQAGESAHGQPGQKGGMNEGMGFVFELRAPPRGWFSALWIAWRCNWVVFNLVCRHRSPLPFSCCIAEPPPLLFSLPPATCHNSFLPTEREEDFGAPPFSCRISAPQLDLGSRNGELGRWDPKL